MFYSIDFGNGDAINKSVLSRASLDGERSRRLSPSFCDYESIWCFIHYYILFSLFFFACPHPRDVFVHIGTKPLSNDQNNRARWRENRTIFNTPNPRLMNVSLLRDSKLCHNQERRGSRMSMRMPSRQPSMASLRPHSPNPSLGKQGSYSHHIILTFCLRF